MLNNNIKHTILWDDCWSMSLDNNFISWIPREVLKDTLQIYVQSIFERK